jgi:hypothetical protein
MLTDVFHVQTLQTGINSVKDMLSTESVVVGVMVLLFQDILVDSDALTHKVSNRISYPKATHLFPVPSNRPEQLCRDHNLIPWQVELLDGFAGNDLADTVRVDVGRVEEVDAGVVGSLDERERFLL